jgi:cobalt/nickel transport system ATP-binding protein
VSHHLVEARDLAYAYPDGTLALDGVSFRITHGEAVAIVGANGAGKSTLIHHLNGHLAATRGEVRIGDVPVTRQTLPAIRRSVGLVFQDADDQLFMPTVSADVAFGPRNLGLPDGEVERRADEALQRVGVAALRDKPPYRLSGGEKKRVAIAGVLAMAPDVLVMDEPTGGLDPFARRQLIALLAEFGHTRIFTSHDLDMVLELCPRTIVLAHGRVMADGPTPEIFAADALLRECRLERPLAMQSCPLCAAARRPQETADGTDHDVDRGGPRPRVR